MIPFSSQRGLGQDLATHLLNEHDNEIMEVAEVRGAVADDLHGAFAEWELQAKYLTKCSKYLYSLSVNPDPKQEGLSRDQYFDYINRIEAKLGLTGQPRAIVFHTKYDRAHAHVVWSRIDMDKEKAIQLSHDRPKLMDVTKEFARDHGLYLPDGYFKDNNLEKPRQNSLYEQHQQNATGITKAQRMEQVTTAWQRSDSAKAFVHALREQGYILATGKRPYVLVDIYGEMNALPKLINDKAVRTKNIRAFLEKDYPISKLPTVEAARTELADQRKAQAERSPKQIIGTQWEQLAHSQTRRREGLEEKLSLIIKTQQKKKSELIKVQANARLAQKQFYLNQQKQVKAKRAAAKPTGLAAFLGQVTGVNLIRKKLHEYQDKKSHLAYQQQRDKLQKTHSEALEEQTATHALQRANTERKLRSLGKIDRREDRSLALKILRLERIAAREGHIHMPPIRKQNLLDKTQARTIAAASVKIRNTGYRGEPLGHAFTAAKDANVPLALRKNLKAAFTRASDTGDKGDGRGDEDTGIPKPIIYRKEEGTKRNRNRIRDKDNDRNL